MVLRNRALPALLLITLIVGIAIVWWWQSRSQPVQDRPMVMMSRIDLQWGSADLGAVARGEGKSDPLFVRLDQDRQIIMVDNVAQLQAAKAKVAMLVQPRPFTPEELARLDHWVQAGGRLLFFADPALQWPSELPFGDPARPLFTSMHSPLFAHWGLELVLPIDPDATTSETEAKVGKQQLRTISPGQWLALKSGSGKCRIAEGGLVAECRPGKGQAILVADADLLHSALWQSALPGGDSSPNLSWTMQLLDRLERGSRLVGQRGEILE